MDLQREVEQILSEEVLATKGEANTENLLVHSIADTSQLVEMIRVMMQR